MVGHILQENQNVLNINPSIQSPRRFDNKVTNLHETRESVKRDSVEDVDVFVTQEKAKSKLHDYSQKSQTINSYRINRSISIEVGSN